MNPIELTKIQGDLLLKAGYKSFSKFGLFCPVELQKGKKVLKQCFGALPVIFREYILFLRNEENVKRFLENPSPFINQNPTYFLEYPKTFVIGPPKTGKTFYAKRLAVDLDIEYISLNEVTEKIKKNFQKTLIFSKLEKMEQSGKSDDEVLVECLEFVLSLVLAKTKG